MLAKEGKRTKEFGNWDFLSSRNQSGISIIKDLDLLNSMDQVWQKILINKCLKNQFLSRTMLENMLARRGIDTWKFMLAVLPSLYTLANVS